MAGLYPADGTCPADRENKVDQSVPGGSSTTWPHTVNPQRRSRTSRRVTALVAIMVVVVLVGAFWKLPYYTFSPGSLRATQSLVSVSGATTYPDDDGEIGYLTVTFGQATPFGLVRGWVDSDIEVLSEDQALGGLGRDENRELNQQMMTNAKDTATVVALEYLGYDVELLGSGAVVVGVEPGIASDGLLEPGDTIVSVNDEAVTTSTGLIEVIAALAPGDEVVLGVQRHDNRPVATPADDATGDTPGDARPEVGPPAVEVPVTLQAYSDDPQRPFLGVRLATRDQDYNLPFDVEIDSGNVIGPSAGLAFTLAIIDVLTPGSLTGGQIVGVTGTISADGAVGRVGGVDQKAAAAIGAGATLYLVPADEVEEARRRAGDAIEVVAVSTLDEALAALADRGGESVGLR